MRFRQRGLKSLRFHDLTPFRIREVLLVSSPYDAFILEEDGQLTEQVFFEYREVSASGPPRFTHVPTGNAALAALERRRFDLILVMTSLAGMGVNAFGRRVKQLRPGRPVILLAIDDRELAEARESVDPRAIDGTFLWSGDALILFAVIKLIEDRDNVAHDLRRGNVRVIIVIEDSPRFYSLLLGLLYKELIAQSRSLSSEGVNELHRMMYMRSRPKILHAQSYEEGMELFQSHRSNVIAVISDVAVPRQGTIDAQAGLDFVRFARRKDPDLPVLLQSSDADNAAVAEELSAAFLDKNSPTLLAEIRSFMSQSLGFGDFIFRLPGGEEVGKAHNLREMEAEVGRVPAESLAFHAAHNHFSIWLMARSEFELAERLRPRKPSDYDSIESLREHLVGVLRDARQSTLRGHVTDLDHRRFEHDLISRTGKGALGGKARGIAFLNRLLSERDRPTPSDLPVRIPKTVVVTTDIFDQFLDENDLRSFVAAHPEDREISRRFVRSSLPEALQDDLRFLVESFDGALAVRSSSLLEDSLHRPFAGVYATLMIPNNADSPEQRLVDLASAVKLVYASAFGSNARSYLNTTGHHAEEERMAVIIQQLVGRQYDNRFYPTFSGVAQSFNYYPVGPQRPADGVVHVALGLGRTVVDGGLALRFSPEHPDVLPQFSIPKALLDATQRTFYALDMNDPVRGLEVDPTANVKEFGLELAEHDGTLQPIGSVFVPQEERFREDLSLPGPRVVSFANVLKHRAIPLAETLQKVLQTARRGLGGPVEIEFACDMGDWGQPTPAGREREGPQLYLLQMRPLGSRTLAPKAMKVKHSPGDVLCASSSALGHGIERDVRDIVYVRRDNWEAAANKAIARELDDLNRRLRENRRPYLLIGPGRWGSADSWLGIPVQWRQISNARVIIEASPSGYNIEPSQGTHFFHNITALRIAYFTLPPGVGAPGSNGRDALDWAWLDDAAPHQETRHLRHVRLDEPLTVILDARHGRGLILKPGVEGQGTGPPA